MNPQRLTELLWDQVPVLNFVGWRLTEIEPGRCASVLPLNPESTNQHFTHQAALFVLAADYTGGISVASNMMGWPIAGVHPARTAQSMSVWLVKVEIKYQRPSVGDLRVSAEVDPARRPQIVRRFLDGKVVLESVTVRCRNGDTDVAEATLTYFARQSEKLRCNGDSPDKVNILYQLKLASSAELIAGVRARESGKLFVDPYAAQMAGPHGMALAARLCEKTPQLGGMVAARTRHLDREMRRFLAAGGREIVLLGVGWDMRPFRLEVPEGTRIYELDFPTTLTERARRIDEIGLRAAPGVERVAVPIDLRTKPLCQALPQLTDGRAPVFIACEGMLMYFDDEEARATLMGIAPLLRHPGSRLWIDLVDRQVIDDNETVPAEVRAFTSSMELLGEPFTFGVDDVDGLLSSVGLRREDLAASSVFHEASQDPVYGLYRFCVASGAAAGGTLAARDGIRVEGSHDGPLLPPLFSSESTAVDDHNLPRQPC